MAFNPGTGGGSSSIAGSTDVTLNSPQDDQVLAYDSGSAKWQNQLPDAAHPFVVNGHSLYGVYVKAASGTIPSDLPPCIIAVVPDEE